MIPRVHPNTRRRLLLAPLLAAAMLSACLSSSGDDAPTPPPTVTPLPASATPSGPTATPTPDLAVLLQDGGIAIIEIAYDRLLDEYIDPVETGALLRAAWDGAEQYASLRSVATPPDPTYGGDRDADFAAFRAAYVPLAAAFDDPKELRFAAIRTMAQSLRDCHTFFLNPVAASTIEDARTGKGVVGVGIELASVPPLVTEVIPGGPAAKAGMLVGDRIASIDGASAAGLAAGGAFDLINGAEGTTVRIAVRRGGETLDLEMRRARVTPPNVATRVIGDIGYVRVRNFVDDGIAKPLRDALDGFERDGIAGWVIDMRDNPGGRLDSDAISLFVPSGTIVRDRGRGDFAEEIPASGDAIVPLRPAVVLTNSRTGSVAEIFASALDEHDTATIVGAATNGCAGFTDIQPFGDGSSMAVTTHENLGPVSGAPLSGVGVIPDIPIDRSEADIAAGRDPQLDAAVAHLSGH